MLLLPRRWLLLALVSGLVSTSGLLTMYGQTSSVVECRWAATPPIIDGRSDDPVWQRAHVIDNFRQGWLPNAPAARQRTRARLLWDREWIYLFAEMEDTEVTADEREHDGPLWKNDVIELFLRPSERHAGYYEFEVNPFGAVLDAFFSGAEGPDPDRLKRGLFHVDAKVVINGTLNEQGDRDTGWCVEARIPWADFNATGGRPAPGETWRVNVARVDGPAPGSDLSSAAPLTKRSFHRTTEFSSLRFVGPDRMARELWENTKLIGSPEGAQGYRSIRAWPQLAARSLVGVTPTPDGEWLWFIEQEGGREGHMRLRRLRTSGDGSDAETLLELEDLVYSVAFHPRFAENGFVYLGANGPRKAPPRSSQVMRYAVKSGRLEPDSRTVVLQWASDGHNGAALAFSKDGLLFVTSGDGTSHSDIDNVGQDLRTLRSKILRIDVDRPAAGKLYSVPADNPFVNDWRFAPETWAYGLRNPWRLTYDAESGQLWAGENGQDAWEYARLVQRGANYGWSVYEGSHVFAKARPLGPHPVTFPTLEFSHAEFRSLTGGVVYRGKEFSELVGAYVFGDFGTGRVWAAKHDGTRLEWLRELIDTPFSLTHITADPNGELLLVDYGVENRFGGGAGGAIYRLERVSAAAIAVGKFPRQLSATGLFSDAAKLTPAKGVLPYAINVPGWHDGATGVHHLALPGNVAVEVRPRRSWQLPDGAVLAQTLVLGGRRIETRMLVKQQNDFAGYTYVWNEGQTDAQLADKGGTDLELADGRPWRVPSRAECMMCHSREANFSLTLHESQLNHGDQLARWESLGLLRVEPNVFGQGGRPNENTRAGRQQPNQRTPVASSLLPRNPERLAKFAASTDTSASLETRARSYLGVNCAHCHTINGGGNSAINFDWQAPLTRMRAFERPQHGDFEIPDAKVIAPGAAGRSVIIPRVAMRGPGQMPPVGSRVPDSEGVQLLAEWIASLKP